LAGAAGARDDRAAAGERLEDRDAEPLVQRRVREAAGAAVELGELLVRDLAEPAHRAGQLDTAPAARTDHAQLDLEALRGGREALEVLAGLERPDCEHEVALGSAAVRREDGGDGVRDDADALLVDAQQLDE